MVNQNLPHFVYIKYGGARFLVAIGKVTSIMKKTVVILEDDTDIREIIEYILRKEGMEVKSYNKAKSFWAEEHSDASLFLLDIRLPDGNGLEICCDLRSRQETAGIPIVMMSAHTDRILNSDCIPADFIRKPFEIDDLVSRIKHLIR